jgi:hypothetical protein
LYFPGFHERSFSLYGAIATAESAAQGECRDEEVAKDLGKPRQGACHRAMCVFPRSAIGPPPVVLSPIDEPLRVIAA